MPILGAPGVHALRAAVRPGGGATTFTNTLEATVLPEFRSRKGDATWRVLFVPIEFGGNAVVEAFQPNAPASALHQETAAKGMAHARMLFPFDHVEHRVAPVCRIVEPPSSLGALSAWTVERMLYGIHAASRQYDAVVGLVPNLWLSATMGAAGLTDLGSPTCLVADDIVRTADRGGWRPVENPCIFTHEIGHCYNLDHPSGPRHEPIQGYDLATDQAIHHATFTHREYDIMYVDIDGEAPPDVWIDQVSYTNFMRTLYTRGGVSLEGISLHKAALGGKPMPLNGGLFDGALLLRGRIAGAPGAYAVTQATVRVLTDVPPPPHVDGGFFKAELRGAAGLVLAETTFDPVWDTDGSGATQGVYAVQLPWDDGAQSVVIGSGGATIWSRARSVHAPSVALTAPAPGAILTGIVPASWTAADDDGDPLVYAIEASLDGGMTWLSWASGMTNAVADLDSRLIENTTNAWLRVSAWDGFDVALAAYGPYTVSNSAAILFTAPADGVSNASATGQGVVHAIDAWGFYHCLDASTPTNLVWAGWWDTMFSSGVRDLQADEASRMAMVLDWAGTAHVLDASDPTDPVLVGALPLGDVQVCCWGADQRVYAFSATGGLCVVDASNPAAPVVVRSEHFSGFNPKSLRRDGDRLVAANGFNGVTVFDLGNPDQPARIVQAASFEEFSDVVDAAMRGELVAAALENEGLALLSISGGTNLVHASTWRQSSPAARINAVGIASNAVICNDVFGGMRLMALLPPDADHDGFLDEWERATFGSLAQVPHGDADGDGLSTLDELRLGADPFVFDSDGDGLPDGWEVRYGLDPTSGTEPILDIHLRPRGLWTGSTAIRETAMASNLVYAIDGQRLHMVDISDPDQPQARASTNMPALSDFAVRGRWLFLTGFMSGLMVMDVGDPNAPAVVSDQAFPNGAEPIALAGDLLFVYVPYHGSQAIAVLSITNPAVPVLLSSVPHVETVTDLKAEPGRLAVFGPSFGLRVYDTTDPMNLTLLGTANSPGGASVREHVQSQTAFVA